MAFRFASIADSAALLQIYSQYIDTPITFEYALPTEAEFARRIEETSAQFPYLIWEEDGCAAGYAYAHPLRERAAYPWSVELSIYLDAACTARGGGRRLYALLLELLTLQGVRTAYGCVTVPNQRSERLHAALGFARVGAFHRSGFKNGMWHDVAWFEKPLAPHPVDPAPLTPFPALPPEAVKAVLARFS